MISRIRGVLIEKAPPNLVVEVGGISYDIEASMGTIYELPDVGQEVVLHTHLAIREDAYLLYGFSKAEERSVFRKLLKVNGIGAKIALAILSALSLSDLLRVIMDEDVLRLTKVPGVGRKTAERLILELRGKLSDDVVGSNGSVSASFSDDAVSALVSLGYSDRDARAAIKNVDSGLPLSEIIRQALKLM